MTVLLYLQDTYFFEEVAIVIDIGSSEFWDYIILDQTIFYPQGGWQPSDMGTITSWNNIFQVTKCSLGPEWIVYHYGNGNLKIWDIVHLQIDNEKRLFNARNHSAGHLIDVAMMKCGYNSTLTPTKWYHFPGGAYVEYQREFQEDKEVFIEKMNQVLVELIQQDIPIIITQEWLWDLKAPTWKSPRYVYFEWYEWCGCGGTHVKTSWEIWWVSIRKVKYKKGVLKVSYIIQEW